MFSLRQRLKRLVGLRGHALQPQHVLQSYHQAGLGGGFADAADYAGHIAVAAQGVVAQGDRLARRAEDYLVVGAPAGQADAVYGYAIDVAAPGFGQVFLFGDVAGELLLFRQAVGDGTNMTEIAT